MNLKGQISRIGLFIKKKKEKEIEKNTHTSLSQKIWTCTFLAPLNQEI